MTADQDPSSRKPNSKTGANRKQTPRNKAATEHPRRPKPSTNVSGIEEWVELLCTVKLAKKRACCDAFLGKAGPEATVVSFPWRVDDKKDLMCLEKEMGLEQLRLTPHLSALGAFALLGPRWLRTNPSLKRFQNKMGEAV